MTINISQEAEAHLSEEAKRLGLSVDAFLERLISERVEGPSSRATGELPRLHLGPLGALRRREIYDDAS